MFRGNRTPKQPTFQKKWSDHSCPKIIGLQKTIASTQKTSYPLRLRSPKILLKEEDIHVSLATSRVSQIFPGTRRVSINPSGCRCWALGGFRGWVKVKGIQKAIATQWIFQRGPTHPQKNPESTIFARREKIISYIQLLIAKLNDNKTQW